MDRPYKIADQGKAHFITTTVVDWVDVFTRKAYRDIIIDSLQYAIEHKALVVYGYVIMSNHVHIVLQAKDNNLSDILRDFKKFTAKAILRKIQTEIESRREWMLERFKKATETHQRNKNYQFWRYGNHAEEIYTEKFLWSKLDYIHQNPVKAGIISRPQDYRYSSASNYINNEGLLAVTLAANPVVDVLQLSNIKNYIRYD